MLLRRGFLRIHSGRRHCRCRWFRGARSIGHGRNRYLVVRLPEGNVDDVVPVVAEGVDINVADQDDVDGGLVALDPLVDRGDIRRRCDPGVRQIEIERAAERQCQLLVVQHRRDADAVRHLEHKAHESRLHQGAHANERSLLGFGRGTLHPQRAFSRARPFGQFADDFDRKARRRAAPAIGQEIDEDALAGGHGVDGRPARQRQPDRRTVRVAAGGRNIIGRRFRQFVDGDIDRAIEPDHDDRAGGRDLRVHILGELEHQPRVTAGG
ncbi:MAG: hypothetical protein E6G70_10520 [Alphaproteobacteria bacterium]|nr:MAG: hypothetical protein E6G70_10520 [Alphaproteobacteria bacterium]